MKYTSKLLLLPAFSILLASNTLAQAADPQAASLPSPAIIAARCQYAPADGACARVNESGQAKHDETTLAQLPRRVPGPPLRPQRPSAMYRGAGYPGMWAGEGSGRRAAIGALIGLGLGAAIGARGGARASFAFAMIGAGCGAGFGMSLPPFPAHRRYWGPGPGEDDLASLRDQGPGTKRQEPGIGGQ